MQWVWHKCIFRPNMLSGTQMTHELCLELGSLDEETAHFLFRAVATDVLTPLTSPLQPAQALSTPQHQAGLPLRHTVPNPPKALKRQQSGARRPSTTRPPPSTTNPSAAGRGGRAAPATPSRSRTASRRGELQRPPLPASSRPNRGASGGRQGPGSVGQGPAPRRGVRGLGSVGELQRGKASGGGGVRGARPYATAKGHSKRGEGRGGEAVPGRRRRKNGGNSSSCQKWVGASRWVP